MTDSVKLKIKEMEEGISSICNSFEESVFKPACEVLFKYSDICQADRNVLTPDFHKAYARAQDTIGAAALALGRLNTISATIPRAPVTIEES